MRNISALPLILLMNFSVQSELKAAPNPSTHALCRDARDYQGCVNSQSAISNSEANTKMLKRSEDLDSCYKAAEEAISSKPQFHKYTDKRSKIPEVCATILEYTDSVKGNEATKSMQEEVKMCIVHGIFNDWPPSGARGACICFGDFMSANAGYSGDDSLKYCLSKFRAGSVAGFRLLSDKEGLRFGYREETIRQASIRGSHGRYLSFKGRSESAYRGSSGYIIPGQKGYIDCGYRSSGSIYGWSSGGDCYGETGTQPLFIPGQSGGLQNGIFSYLLDCQDKTFDRKGDLSSVSGGNKGWMDISEDPVAAYVADAYCPIIRTLPKAGS